ncbi:MAG: aminotransferase class V-fold PLP-dependent enzyme [Phycisphaerales bacterium]|nr:aminotransferase class V-fold PLP-dependent enzyme [Phycisphaerales bacterium]
MHPDFVYLDNAATSWPKPDAVAVAMSEFLSTRAGNPGRGGHALARAAAETVEIAREKLAALINAPTPKRVVLTHGCTDAINQAIQGVIHSASKCAGGKKPHIVTTAIEHNAVLRTLHSFKCDGLLEMTIVPCDSEGTMSPDRIADACTPCTELVAVSHASNVLGTIQPIHEIMLAVRAKCPEVLFMVDAAQTAGHFSVDVQRDDIDLLTLAGHKGLRGPTGTGALYVGPRAYPDCCTNTRMCCERRGGTGAIAPGLEMPTTLPDALEAGTANAVGFAGLVAAMGTLCESQHRTEMMHTKRLLDGLLGIPNVTVYGKETTEGRTPVVLFNIKGMCARDAGKILDEQHHIAVRGGVHCAPELHNAIGTKSDGGVRVSPGCTTTEDQIDCFLEAVRSMASTPAMS